MDEKPLSTAPQDGEVAELLQQYPNLLQEATLADDAEHEVGLRKAIVKHYPAALWSMFLSTALIMEGYDLGSIGSFFAQPAFQQRFGVGPDGEKVIPAAWQTGLNNGALVGEIIGLTINGWAQERFGYKRTMLCALFVMGAAIFAPVFAKSLPVLEVGFVLEGIPWGVFQTLTTSYAAELCPQVLRPYLTSYVNMCWGLGILLSSGIVRATLSLPGDWSWRVPYMLQWFWVIVLPIGVLFAPEAPWWLVRKGRFDDARDSIRRVTRSDHYSEERARQQIALMRYTTALEKQEVAGARLIDCFKGTNLRRTEIACMVFAIQWLCGDNIIAYSVLFFTKAGLPTTQSFDLNIGLSSMYTIGTIISWFLMRAMGLRTLYIFGLMLMAAILLIIGILGFFQHSLAVAWAIGAIMVVVNLAYNISIGPACYSIVAIVPAGRVRGKTIVLARNTYNIVGLIANTITPRMIAEDAWNWGARGALLYMGTAIIAIVWCYFRLPELKHRSYAELDVLFADKIPARKFARTQVDLFGDVPLATDGDVKTEGRETRVEQL